jgi:hypothetical protein
MKSPFKILLVSLCILFSSLIFIYNTKGTNFLRADAGDNIQPTSSINDNVYTVLIYTGGSLLPEHIDQFEFEAGDVFTVSSQDRGELTGIWQETDLVVFGFFNAQVESPDTTTTTTISTTIQESVTHQPAGLEKSQFLINLSGLSFQLLRLPFDPPDQDPFVLKIGAIIGAGAYLGADTYFIGFTSITEEPEFGSVNPDSGEQGDREIGVTITCKNTNFKTGETDVSFSGDGITVGTPDVDSKTELFVEIDIAEDAPTGRRDVTVSYTGGIVSGADVFEVTEKTDIDTTTTTTASE